MTKGSFRVDHVRGLLRVMAEAKEHALAGSCAKQALVRGLCALIDAEVGILYRGSGPPSPSRLKVQEMVDWGWGTSSDRSRMLSYLSEHGDPLSTEMARRRADVPVVFRRRDLVADDDWYPTELCHEIHRPLRLDDVICGMRVSKETEDVTVAVFKRRWGARPFSPEERNLVSLWFEQSRVFGSGRAPENPWPARLSRRELETTRLLLRGLSEKEAAAAMNISVHTLHGYVKALYRKLDVASRSELLTRLASPSRAASEGIPEGRADTPTRKE